MTHMPRSTPGPNANGSAPICVFTTSRHKGLSRSLFVMYLVHNVPHSFPEALHHLPYVRSLPPAVDLWTPLHFTAPEREILKGTNLYGATLDRERDWRAEWEQCRSLVQDVNPTWGDAFTWALYLTASTHLSSRAFPSSLLSPTPSLVSTPSTYPVLIPGVDLLNHKRGQPVSWLVSCPDVNATTNYTIAIVAHPKTEFESDSPPHQEQELVEVFNNYGPKPNDELILGYGFSLPNNPDDTITLQIGSSAASSPSQKWVVGRHAHNAEGLWSQVRCLVANGESEYEFEDDLETAAALSDMVQAKLDGIKTEAELRRNDEIRSAVRAMLEHYFTGQRDILESILEFLNEKRNAAIKSAREQGIDLVFDEDD
ncbi:hypothetical protein JVU11DRAFT_8943 [Chiua virens]|nr:hypothetical protein JVU11DRAFT_8943 [Chiua virens]